MKRWTTNFHINEKKGHSGFENLDKLIDNLNDYADTIKDELDSDAAKDAAYIAEILAKKYDYYMSKDYYLRTESGVSPKFQRSKVVLGHENGHYKDMPVLEVRKMKDGYHILMSGKDIIYQEYGTGTMGKENPYPGTLPKGWKYGSGPKVLQGGKYKNGSSLNEEIPKWYLNLLNEGAIRKSDMVWYSPRGISLGDPAGAFMFETWDEVIDELDNPQNTELKLGRRNLNIHVKNKITKGIE